MKKGTCILLIVCLLLNLFTIGASAYTVQNNVNGDVYSAYISDVGSDSSKLKTDSLDNGENRTTIENFKFYKHSNGDFEISGAVNDMPFNVVGTPFDSPANKMVQVFDASDLSGNFDVLYLNIEKELQDSALYFDSVDLDSYLNLVKLYLRPINSSDFVVIEFFLLSNIASDYLSRPISSDTSDPGRVNQLWYTKVFEPAEVYESEVPQPNYIKDWSLTSEYVHTFEHLGHEWKQEFEMTLYVAYPTSFSNEENFKTAIEVLREEMECLDAPNESSDSSNIYMDDIRIDIAVDTGSFCSGYTVTGYCETAPKASVTVELNSIPLWKIASISVDYEERTRGSLNSCSESFIDTNKTPRELGVSLDSDKSFSDDGDYLHVAWPIENRGGAGSDKEFKVRFTYRMNNYNFDEPVWDGKLYQKDVTVYYDTTA